MCDSAEGNWVWTLRERKSGKPVQTNDGYSYYFADEADAKALVERLGRADVDLIHMREPGA